MVASFVALSDADDGCSRSLLLWGRLDFAEQADVLCPSRDVAGGLVSHKAVRCNDALLHVASSFVDSSLGESVPNFCLTEALDSSVGALPTMGRSELVS